MSTLSEWKNFTVEELTCRCGCGRMEMDNRFMQDVVQMRIEADFPFMVSSGYRCPEYNMQVSSTGMHGPHTTGRAIDVLMSYDRLYRFLELFYKYSMTGLGVGIHRGFIHIDNLDADAGFVMRPNSWGY